jgi:hypothetical protein
MTSAVPARASLDISPRPDPPSLDPARAGRVRAPARGRGDGVDDELDVTDPHAGVGPQLVGDDRRWPSQRSDAGGQARSVDPPRPARQLDQDGHGPLDGRRIAPDVPRRLVDDVAQGRHARRGVARIRPPHVPGVRLGQGDAQHPRTLRTDEQRRTSGSRTTRQQLTVARLEVPPIEVDGPLAQERGDDRERFLEAIDAVVEREAEGVEFDLVPARAQAEHEAATTDLIDRRRLLGQQCRVVEAGAGHERTDLHARGRGRDGGHQRPGLPRSSCRPIGPAVEQMLADPDRIEALVLDGAGQVEQLGPAHLALDLGQLDPHVERPPTRRGTHRAVAGLIPGVCGACRPSPRGAPACCHSTPR